MVCSTPQKSSKNSAIENITVRFATKNNPQGNGLIERGHRIVNEILRINKIGKNENEIQNILYR